ncbi:MAG: RDD family protein, partial [Candidatus Eremiobacteraeota bacterium]|nr:RDD family protein [Candidatus Eremiobacteraeota bacterium]
MERSVSVRTPEAIAFYYELAGLGSRFLALAVDMIIQSLAALVIVILAFQASGRASMLAHSLHLGGKTLASTVLAVSVFLFFALFYGYFIAFEKLWNGQTPGKRLLGIRVVRDGGYPVELVGSTIRNLIRVIESVLGFYFLSVISMLLSSENKRLGDFAAGTIVVRDRGFEVRDPASWLRPGAGEMDASNNGLVANLTPEELALVDKYVARKTSLDHRSAGDAAAKIASALRPKLPSEYRSLPD